MYQPQVPGYPPYGVTSLAVPATGVKNYMVPAVLCALLTFFPTGIAAIVYAAKVNPALQLGDVAGALQASSKAKLFCWISLGIGIVLWLIVLGG